MGIDCRSGADSDGSVICLDGFRDSEELFRFRCIESKLKFQEVFLTDKTLLLTIRNISAVNARDISVFLEIKKGLIDKTTYPLLGDMQLEAYSLSDYTLELDGEEAKQLKEEEVMAGSLSIQCKNCSRIVKNK